MLGALGLREAGRAEAARIPGTNRIRGGWYGFCGHYFTTGSCPGPYELPRIDARGFPLRPADGRPIDDLGRLDRRPRPAGRPRGAAPAGPRRHARCRARRARACARTEVPRRFGVDAVTQGAWYRCCDDQIRKLTDCCTTNRTRINGDAGLRGYCRPGRRVFCVMYYDTGVPC